MSVGLASWVVRRRRGVLFVLAVAAACGAVLAPRLEARFDPTELVALDEDLVRVRAELEDNFGVTADPIVIVVRTVEHADVLTDDSLRALHALARATRALDGVERVESLTTSRLPIEPPVEETSLDGLEEIPAEVEEDVRRVVMAEPTRFPAGLLSLSRSVTMRSIGGSEELTAEQAELTRALVASTPLVVGRLVSRDRDTAVVVVFPRRSITGVGLSTLLAEIRAICARHPFAGHELRLGGLPAMRDEMVSALSADQGQLVALAVLGTIVILLLGMRGAAGVLLPLGAVGIALALVLGAMVWGGLSLNLLTNMLPPLLLTIGLAEAMHMVLRHRDEVAAGLDVERAAIETLRTMWLPCLVTTVTTAIGFAALLTTESLAVREFGAVAAAATMVVYFVTVLFVPAALPLFRAPDAPSGAPRSDRLEDVLVALANATANSPRRTIALATVAGVVALVLARGVVVESRLGDQFARGSEVAETSRLLETELDGFRAMEVAILAEPGTFHGARGLELLDEIAREARGHEDVLSASSISDLAHEVLAQLSGDASARGARLESDEEVASLLALLERGDRDTARALVTADGSAARVEVRLRDAGATRTIGLAEALRGAAERAAQQRAVRVEVLVGGEAYTSSHGLERIVRALGGLGVAVLTIFVVMAMLFRSVRLGLLAVPPNVLPLVLTLAYMALRGIALHAATVIVFTVTVGLAVDGTTHVVARFREEMGASDDLAEVLRRTVRGSGRAVLLSSLTLCVGYAVLLTSRFEPIRLFGELSLVAIAGATVSQTLFLPALLAIWGVPNRRGARAQSESRPSSDEVNAASSGK